MLNRKIILLCIVATLLVATMEMALAENVAPVSWGHGVGHDDLWLGFYTAGNWHIATNGGVIQGANAGNDVGYVTRWVTNLPEKDSTITIWSHDEGKGVSSVVVTVEGGMITQVILKPPIGITETAPVAIKLIPGDKQKIEAGDIALFEFELDNANDKSLELKVDWKKIRENGRNVDDPVKWSATIDGKVVPKDGVKFRVDLKGGVTKKISMKVTSDGFFDPGDFAQIEVSECYGPRTVQSKLTTTTIMHPPKVISSDDIGVENNVFALIETVYCYAEYLPANDSAVDIHVVPNKAWSVGDLIGPDVSGGVETVSTDASGNIGITKIWPKKLTAGQYDIIVDLDQDGVLDANEPVDGFTMGEGFKAIPEFPTIALPILAILGLAFIFQRRRN